MEQQRRRRQHNWFSKATRIENVGRERLAFCIMQGENQLYVAVIEPGRNIDVFGSDYYRNDSKENPISAYVHLVGVGLEQLQWWTPLDRSLFENVRIRVAGGDSVEIPIEFQPFKGSNIGRLRVVVEIKKFVRKIRGLANED